ncbi:MAG TPA: signal peptidase I [Nevskiaceae bacterium]|nr:signal peptidase I [Nevskiaceae bacterium]
MNWSEVHLDFAVLLTALTLITGVGFLLEKLVFAPRRGPSDKPNWALDFSRSFFPVIAIVLLLRSFIVEPFRIPSGSMIPTLLVGDFILVNKFTYGLRDPVFHHRFFGSGEPKRGDIVVFRYPVDPSTDFIKRVIGVPGDHVAYHDKTLTINGAPMPLDPAGVYTGGDGTPWVAQRFTESLSGVQHSVLINPARPAEGFEFTVPAGQYFMMGDNRDGSLDSRVWGTVPEQNLVGRAFLIWMSWDSEHFRPNFDRIGHTIQ